MPTLEKKYKIIGGRQESPDILSLELLDESSQPPIVKTAIFRLGINDDFKALGEPTFTKKLKVTIEVVES